MMLVRLLRLGVVLLLFSLIQTLINPSAAQETVTETSLNKPVEESPARDLGYGVGSVLASVVYSPVKLTYAGLGLLTGGLGYLLTAGRADVADNIIYPAITGDYVVTPRHLKGEKSVIFIGAPPETYQYPK